MFDKTIEKLIQKQLPGIETRLHLALVKSVEETFVKLFSVVETNLVKKSDFDETVKRLDAAGEDGISKTDFNYEALEKKVEEIESVVDNLPNTDDILTSDNFSPSEFDLISKDDSVYVEAEDIEDKIIEALDNESVQEKIGEILAEKLAAAFKR